jgi:hypothetical protein
MGNLLAIQPADYLNNVQQVLGNVGTEIAYVSEQAWEGVVSGIKHADRVSKDNEALENAIRAISYTILSVDLLTQAQNSYQTIQNSFHNFRNTASVVRIFGSISYFASGAFSKDMCLEKVHMLISNTAFLIARLGVVNNWLVDHKLFGDISLQVVPEQFLGIVTQIKTFPVIDMAFGIALSGLAYERLRTLMSGNGSLFHVVDLIGLSFDVALCVMPIFQITNVYIITAFAIIAASAGVGSFILNPEYAQPSVIAPIVPRIVNQ